MSANRNLLGIAAIAGGILLFSLQDAIIKSISHDYAVTLAMAVRCFVSLPILLVMVHVNDGLASLRTPHYGALLMRGCILLVSYTTYYMALPALPLAEAIAPFFAAPTMISLLSIPLLGERTSSAAWAAIILGLCGVLVILQPGTELFNPAALFTLASAATYAFAMVVARKLGVTESAPVMAFYQNAVYLVGAVLIAGTFQLLHIHDAVHPSFNFLVRAWTWPKTHDLLLMASCGIIAAVAMSLLTQAYRMAAPNLVTVFEYTGMVWAPLWGLLFFGEVPRFYTLLGMFLIFVAGLISIHLASRRPS
jgi:drug/metabolite transporter (DMT)-like permease